MWDNFLADWKATHGGVRLHREATRSRTTRSSSAAPTCRTSRSPARTRTPRCRTSTSSTRSSSTTSRTRRSPRRRRRTPASATDAELLAEPQNVIAEAYDKLRAARYPLALPFDLWLETVRSSASYFETPLADVLEAFRPSDDLFAPTQPFDRAAIFIESLGLSPAEAAIFTNPARSTRGSSSTAFTPAGRAPDCRRSTTRRRARPRLGQGAVAPARRHLQGAGRAPADVLRQPGHQPSRDAAENRHQRPRCPVLPRAQAVLRREQGSARRGPRGAVCRRSRQVRRDEPAEWDSLAEVSGFEQRLEQLSARYPPPRGSTRGMAGGRARQPTPSTTCWCSPIRRRASTSIRRRCATASGEAADQRAPTRSRS